MNAWKKIINILYYDSFGNIAIASLLICGVSGVFLAIPYDLNEAFRSISRMSLSNPGAVFFRNLHYWSAQLFLIATIIHTWEHFYKKTERRLKKGVWLRITISIIAIFYVMLSGFILKGDAESLQARRILEALLNDIPLIGSLLSYTLLGPSGSMQVIYMHHLATSTIFIFIITFEHVKRIWTKWPGFSISFLLLMLLSFLLSAPLHDHYDTVVKGPWYFIGMQEVLHWMSRPAYLLLIILALLIAFYYIPFLKTGSAQFTKWLLLAVFIVYAGLTITGSFFRGAQWKWSANIASNTSFVVWNPLFPGDFFSGSDSDSLHLVNGRYESCVVCHDGIEGFTASHSPAAIGCVSCHGGNAFIPDKNLSHKGMFLIPGNIRQAERSCGTTQCHPDITQRIQNTLMTTLSGMVSVDRFVFNELDTPSQLSRITEIGHSAADEHLRDLCASCHLGNFKEQPGKIDQLSRGGGCNACHLNYSVEAEKEMQAMFAEPRPDSIGFSFHPELSLKITNEHCFGCHSRSGRLSTNYEGWHETLLEAEAVPDSDSFRILQDLRVFRFVGEDIHHNADMACIDCHNSYELMGDGNLYMHEEQQVKIRCEDCHFEGKGSTMKLADFDTESSKIAGLRNLFSPQRQYLKIATSAYPMINTYVDDQENKWLIGKNSGDTMPMIAPAAICTQGEGHNSLSCRSCHTSWAPQCIGCHNEFDPEPQGFDLLENRFKEGEWVEYIGEYLSDSPVLGITEDTNGKKVQTFVPGMVLSIDRASFSKGSEEETIFHRLFAPTSAHTTTAKGRSCKSCHNKPNAIGYGRGKLTYSIVNGSGRWDFMPRFANSKYDGLPEDAWIPFLGERNGLAATRLNARPFNIEEQKRILRVGACLTCHKENSSVMLQSLDDFETALLSLSPECILPDWNHN